MGDRICQRRLGGAVRHADSSTLRADGRQISNPCASLFLLLSPPCSIDDYRERAIEAKAAAAAKAKAKAQANSPAKKSVSALSFGGASSTSSSATTEPSPNASPSPDPSGLATTEFPAFAPLKVPMYRRRQTLALAVSSFFSLFCVFAALLCIRASGWVFWLFLAYVAWMFLFQSYHCNGVGFKSQAFRSLKWWTWFRDYFPISLHATAPLDPKGRYIFCYHPHGILSLGAFLNFGSEATGFSKKFPGIDLRLLTLTSNFRIPFYGFFLSLMGIADASRESCNKTLRRGPGSAILLVLGGAKESLDAHPHRDYELTLHRKGFVKVALENHADLVPVFSFGETDGQELEERHTRACGGVRSVASSVIHLCCFLFVL